jgi:NAD(P)-dependent dehydrogenase (short-subunit alcohol dehydrogenase family)
MRQLAGRVAVVTGAASGIGRALAERFASERMKVVLADVERDALDAAVAALQASGAQAIGVRCDVSRLHDVEHLAAVTVDTFGAVHVVCNNAGVEGGAPFADVPAATWDWVLGVNLHGVLNGCRVFLPLLRSQEEAHLVNTASIAALNGYLPTGTPYVASKFAVLGLSENLHHELTAAGSSVGVSVLCPGFVNTNMPTSERNRPDGVPASGEHPARRAIAAAAAAGVSALGLDPAVVAGQVVDAIRRRRFYVLPHRDEALDAVRQRLRWMTDGIPPGPPPGTAAAEAAFAAAVPS